MKRYFEAGTGARRLALILSVLLMMTGCAPASGTDAARRGNSAATGEGTAELKASETVAAETPVPTETPEPTAEPTPSPTPAPTATPAPSPTPKATPTASNRRGLRPDRKMIALTFDDGPNGKITRRIADCLETYGGRGTFFVVGSRVGADAATLKRVAGAGHQIGSHTWSHANLNTLTASQVKTEVSRTQAAVKSVTGRAPAILRPPYGAIGGAARSAVCGGGSIAVVNWSVDSEDWKSRSADSVVKAVLSTARDGDIVLMHDLYASTAEAVERLVPELVRRGYQLVTVDELYRLRGAPLDSARLHFRNPYRQ